MYDGIQSSPKKRAHVTCTEVGTCRFVRIWKFCYEQVSLALKSLQSKSEQNLVHSHIIGFSGSGLGLVKIILGKYIPDWEAGNPWSPSTLRALDTPLPGFLSHTPICQLLFNILLVHMRVTSNWQRGNYGKLLNSLRCSLVLKWQMLPKMVRL